MKKYEIIDFFSKVPKNKPSTKLCQANNFSNKIFDQKPHTPDINNQRSIVGIKQWKRSFYRFDSSNINTQYYRYGALNSYIKSFYNLYYNKKTFISKRARIKLKRNKLSSLILASKPDIKENSSKLQANIYIYDNTVQHQKKKIVYF